MILNAFVSAYRNLRKNKMLAFINVLGLTIGISACLVIFLIASYELSFDRFHADRDRIFRIYSLFTGTYGGTNRGVSAGIMDAVKEEFTGIEAVARFHTFNHKVIVPKINAEPTVIESGCSGIFTNPEYFKVFTFNKWLIGSPEKSLDEPSEVVLTESRAKTLLGNIAIADMIGKQLIYRDSIYVTVSGIIADVEENTDFSFTDIISLATNDVLKRDKIFHANEWGNTNSSDQLFIKLAANSTPDDIKTQMPKLVELYKKKSTHSDWNVEPQLQPLSDLHFNTEMGIFDHSRSVSEKSTFEILIVVALLLLVIAVINFVNLETAQASRRAKEVGVRKVLGSSRRTLVSHFMIDSFILTLLAVICSIGLSYLALLWFSDFIPKGVTLDLANPVIIIFLISCIVVVSLLAGIYPAFVLSSFQPVVALKNQAYANTSTSRSAFIRKTLTIFQFSFSQILIVATIAIGLQIHFMLNKDLGFRSEAVITFWTPWREPAEKRLVLKNELDKVSAFEVVSMYNMPPSANGWSSSVFEYDNGKETLKHTVYRKPGDPNFIKLFNIPLLAGRNLSEGNNVAEYLINETYSKALGFTSPHEALGRMINGKTVVGVVKDFHIQSLHSSIEPVAISNEPDSHFCIGVKIPTTGESMAGLNDKIALLEKTFKKVYPDQKFTHQFVDETIKRFYDTEQRTGKLARAATLIAITISCLGLFGLSSFTVIQRTKEIGIRKVLGASVNSILVLLSSDFLKLVVIAFVLATPAAFFIIEKWLTRFAYRMDITWWLFAAAGLASLITAFFTISFKTVRAAKSDPVKSLRYE